MPVPARITLPGHEDAFHRHWLLLLTWEGGIGGVSRAAANRHMPYPLPQPRQQALAEVKQQSHGTWLLPIFCPIHRGSRRILFQEAKERRPPFITLGQSTAQPPLCPGRAWQSSNSSRGLLWHTEVSVLLSCCCHCHPPSLQGSVKRPLFHGSWNHRTVWVGRDL